MKYIYSGTSHHVLLLTINFNIQLTLICIRIIKSPGLTIPIETTREPTSHPTSLVSHGGHCSKMAGHPLQRLASPSRQVSMLVHTTGIISFLSSFRFLQNWETPISSSFGGHYQFLTIIGLALALCTFTVGLVADLTLSPDLFQAKNSLAVCSAPLEVLITVLFWGLCAIDKNLVFPPESELELLPNFGFHAAPGLFLTLDLLLLSPPWTIDAFAAVALSQTLAFLYWFWIEYCYRQNGW